MTIREHLRVLAFKAQIVGYGCICRVLLFIDRHR